MIRIVTLLGAVSLLGACSTLQSFDDYDDFELDNADFIEAVYLADDSDVTPIVMERIEPVAMAGQLKPLMERRVATGPALKPHETIDRANASAAIEPDGQNFINAIQIYPYTIGALYQVYTAPAQVTDIALQPGEELISVSAGDTMRWVLGDTVSGSGDTEQVHILVKPISSGLTTNLIITTSKRTYHMELTSFRQTYMAAVSWRYPHEELVTRRAVSKSSHARARQSTLRGLQIERLNFRYEIDGDTPHCALCAPLMMAAKSLSSSPHGSTRVKRRHFLWSVAMGRANSSIIASTAPIMWWTDCLLSLNCALVKKTSKSCV